MKLKPIHPVFQCLPTLSMACLLFGSSVEAQDIQTEPAPTPTQPEPARDRPDSAPDAEAESTDTAEGVAETPELPHPELMIGSTQEGVTSENQWANYSFAADAAGLLTVVVRSQVQDNDMAMVVYDADGREIGDCDIDYLGDNGAEHFTVVLPAAGLYRVAVRPLGDGGLFWIGGSWIEYDGISVALPARPSDAQPLTIGNPMVTQLNGNNPSGAWFSITPEQRGFLIVETVANNGIDLQLDLYEQERGFESYSDASDQDRRGDLSREQISIELQPGKTLFFHAYDRSDSNQQATMTVTARIFIELEQPEPQPGPAPNEE
ncbi:MAG: PPC domain-containing protein [Planctomycetota bacterium]